MSTLLLLFLALALHSAVSLMNAVLHTVSPSSLRERAEDGDNTAQRFLYLMDNPLRLSMTVSISHILTRFAIAVLLVLLLIEPITTGDSLGRLLMGIATVALGAGLTLVIGDLLPEAVGNAHAESLLSLSIASMRLLLLVVAPLTALVLLFSHLLSQLFGGGVLANLGDRRRDRHPGPCRA